MHAVHSQPTRKKRGNLPKEATDKLMKWFFLHEDAPYPTEEQKNEIVRQTNLAMSQVRYERPFAFNTVVASSFLCSV